MLRPPAETNWAQQEETDSSEGVGELPKEYQELA